MCDGDVAVDLTTDQFAGEGQPAVLISTASAWHAAWDKLPAEERTFDAEYCRQMRADRYEGLYQKVRRVVTALKAQDFEA